MLTALALLVVSISSVVYAAQSNKSTALGSSGNSTWSMYQHDLARSGYDGTETTINPQTVKNLQTAWTRNVGSAMSTQPVTANGLIYWGSWDGVEHATNPANPTGDIWTSNLGVSPYKQNCNPAQFRDCEYSDDQFSLNQWTDDICAICGWW